MHTLRPSARPETFFHGLAQARERVLMLDFDGTLAPFRARAEQAAPYAGVADILYEMTARGTSRVVLVSGRPVGELRRATAHFPGAEAWGAHGWQHSRVAGERIDYQPGEAARRRVQAAARRALVLEPLGARVERKGPAVAVHWRGLDPEARAEVEARIAELWQGADDELTQVLPFDGGLELRARGRDKGTVVREVLGRSHERAAVAYLGDDLTDEDAFRALRHASGRRSTLGVLVRPRLRRTHADAWLRPPEELLAFLARWRDAAGARPA